jgi:ubiquinone biosynthesis protein UbiJ
VSSPLDGRIRKLAREEALAVTAPGSDPTLVNTTHTAALEKEVAELRAVVQRLDTRLEALEKTAGQTEQEERPATRRTRKASSE